MKKKFFIFIVFLIFSKKTLGLTFFWDLGGGLSQFQGSNLNDLSSGLSILGGGYFLLSSAAREAQWSLGGRIRYHQGSSPTQSLTIQNPGPELRFEFKNIGLGLQYSPWLSLKINERTTGTSWTPSLMYHWKVVPFFYISLQGSWSQITTAQKNLNIFSGEVIFRFYAFGAKGKAERRSVDFEGHRYPLGIPIRH